MMLTLGQYRLIAISLALVGLAYLPVTMAQTPYWDNSSSDQNYYNPGASNNNNQNYGNQGYSNNNNYGNQGNYGQNNSQYGYQDNNNSYGQQQNYSQQAPLKGYVSTAPAGTSMTTTTTTYLSSENSRVGDPVSVTLGYDLAMGGSILLPTGTQIQGQVVSALPAGRTGKHGQLQLRFNRAQLPDGRSFPLSARLVTQDGTGIIRGGTSGQRLGGVAKNTLGGAALGAASGAALGALVGGGNKWNEGLMWGSILGAGGGLARSGIQRGQEAEVQPGTQLQIMLDQPLTINANGGNNGYNSGYPY